MSFRWRDGHAQELRHSLRAFLAVLTHLFRYWLNAICACGRQAGYFLFIDTVIMKRYFFRFCLLLPLMTGKGLAQNEIPPDMADKFRSPSVSYKAYKSDILRHLKNSYRGARDEKSKQRAFRQWRMWNRSFWWLDHTLGDDGEPVHYADRVEQAI